MDTTAKTIAPPRIIPSAELVALEEAVADLIRGIRDPEKMERAALELDEGREEIRRRIGLADMAVGLTDPDE